MSAAQPSLRYGGGMARKFKKRAYPGGGGRMPNGGSVTGNALSRAPSFFSPNNMAIFQTTFLLPSC